VVMLTFGLLASGSQAGDCGYPPFSFFQAGHGPDGYFVRTVLLPGRGASVGPGPIQGIGDYLASEAGSTVIYFSKRTERDLPASEWRAADPLSCFRKFAAAAGLEVLTPSSDLWLVGTAEDWFRNNAAITLFAEPVDLAKQGVFRNYQVTDVEKALLTQLPVRDGEAQRNGPLMAFGGVIYDSLQNEERDTLLVVGTASAWRSYNSSFTYKVFKVRLDRSGGRIRVGCIWGVSEIPAGRLLPEISEDFDGDGYRDFVFDSQGADNVPNYVVLSGKDGHRLFAFSGDELAVERNAAGPKRVAFRAFDEALMSETQAARGLTGSPLDNAPGVFRYSPESRVFGAEAGAGRKTASEASSGVSAPGVARRLLAKEVGGAEKIRVYLMGEVWWEPQSRSEQVKITLSAKTLTRITSEMVKAGYPAHILYEYKSPGYLVAEEQRQQEIRH